MQIRRQQELMGHIVTKLLLDESMGLPRNALRFDYVLDSNGTAAPETGRRQQLRQYGLGLRMEHAAGSHWPCQIVSSADVNPYTHRCPTAVIYSSQVLTYGGLQGLWPLKTLPIREAQCIKCSLVMDQYLNSP